MSHWTTKILPIICISLCFAGCFEKLSTGSKQPNPQQIAEQFWAASKTGDIEKIKPFITQSSQASEMMKQNAGQSQGEYRLGEVHIEGNKATVDTILKEQELNLELKTVLIQENGQWRVDVDQTVLSMMGGALGSMAQHIEQGLQKGVEQGLKGLEQGLNGLAKGIGEAALQVNRELAKNEGDGTANLKKGDAVLVKWGSSWWEAHVEEVAEGKWYISYDGYSSSWNEWVTQERIRGK